MSLLQKFGLKKKKSESLFKQTVLSDDDWVYLNSRSGFLFLVRNNDLYQIEEKPLEINLSNPKVFFRRLGEPEDWLLEECQPYGKLKNSLNQQPQKHF